MNRKYNAIIGGLTFSLMLLSYTVISQNPHASRVSDEIAYDNDDTNRFDYTPQKNLPDYQKEMEEERRRTYVPYEESHRKYLEETRQPNINKHHDFLMEDHPLQEEPLQQEPMS
ncbi:MAG: hypothetical protein WD595_00195 [Waddliaceae bacterium]